MLKYYLYDGLCKKIFVISRESDESYRIFFESDTIWLESETICLESDTIEQEVNILWLESD